MRISVGRSEPDHYTMLGLTPSASGTDVTRAYRNLMRQLHPDTQTHRDLSGSTAEFNWAGSIPGAPVSPQDALRHVMDSYHVLGDPVRRAAYDHDRIASLTHSGPDAVIRVDFVRGGRPAPIKAGPVRWHQ